MDTCRPGTIKSIVEYTGLDRHQVAALLKNEIKYIPLKALSRLCDYLIEHGHATADQLPGALFAVEPENFWELLARRKRLEMCIGVRRDFTAENPDVSFVVASDSVLMGELFFPRFGTGLPACSLNLPAKVSQNLWNKLWNNLEDNL